MRGNDDLQTRILVVTKYFSEGFGGTPEAILLLARSLNSVGVATDVVTPGRYFVNVHQLISLPKKSLVQSQLDLRSLNVYHGLYVCGAWNFRALLFAILARRKGIPISYAPKGCLGWGDFTRLRDIKKIPYFIIFEIVLWLLANTIVFSSDTERDFCVVPKALWKRKCAVIPEPFSPPALSLPPKDMTSEVVIGFLAEIRALKGLKELVEAMRLLKTHPEMDRVRLRVAGAPRPGSERYLAELRAYVVRVGLDPNIEWLGEVRGLDNRNKFYRSLDIFVCPSKLESFGLTPLEALWSGIPVAMGTNIGVRSYIPEGAPVVVFGKVKPEAIALSLQKLILARREYRERALAWREQLIPGLAGDVLARTYLRALLVYKSPE